MEHVVVSPLARDPSEVPDVSVPDFLLARVRSSHLPALQDTPWMVDVLNNTTVTFGQLEEHSRRVASALTRLGFSKGDRLFFVTYEMAQVYVVMLAVWRLGGAVRGCYQAEQRGEYTRQVRETGARLVLVDRDTAPLLREACTDLEWTVTLLSVGPHPVQGTTHFTQLLQDHGDAFPAGVEVCPREDVLAIPNTSGSTGAPKGAMLTHHAALALVYPLRGQLSTASQLSLAGNFSASCLYTALSSLYAGATVHHLAKFTREQYLNHLAAIKPAYVTMYPYVASWFARTPELDHTDLSFVRLLVLGGSAVDQTTASLLQTRLPRAAIMQVYAMSECLGVAFSAMDTSDLTHASLKTMEYKGSTYVSSGPLLPYVQAKVVDLSSGEALGRCEAGELYVRAPYTMLGYLTASGEPDRAEIDKDGWYRTGDLAFFDHQGCVYILDRKSSIFKYYMHAVSPHDLEAALQSHPAVQGAGVVGVPHPETTSLATALVVLSPGHAPSPQLAERLQRHVAERLPHYMHLHGGVRFVHVLPANRGGKLDRAALREIALSHVDSTSRGVETSDIV